MPVPQNLMSLSVPELQEHLARAGVRSSKNNNFLRTKRDMCLALTHASSSVLEDKVRQVGAGRKSLDTAFRKAEDDLAEVKSAKSKAKDLVRDLQTQRKSLLMVQPVPGTTLDAANIANRYRSGAVQTEHHLRSASLQHKEIQDLENSIRRRQMLLAQLKAGVIEPDAASLMTQIHALALQQEEILEAVHDIKVQQHVTRKQLMSDSNTKENQALHKSMTRLSSMKGHLDKQHSALDREIKSRADQVGKNSKDLMEAHGHRKKTLNEKLSKLDKEIRLHKTESQDLVQTVELTKPNTSEDSRAITKERDMLLARLQSHQQSLASAEIALDKLLDRVHHLDIDTQGLNTKISEDPEDLAELLGKIDGVVSNAETLTQEIESTQRALKVQNEQLDALNQSYVDLLKMTDNKVDIPDGESIDSVDAVERLKEYITGSKAISQALEDNKEEMVTLQDTHQKVIEKLKAIDVVASQVPDLPVESQAGGAEDQTSVLLALDKLAADVDKLVEQRTRLGQRLASSLEDTRMQLQQQKEQLEKLAADKVLSVENQRNRLIAQLQKADDDAAAVRSELQSVLSRIDDAQGKPELLASLKNQMTRVLDNSVKTARERDAVQRELETMSSLKTAIHLQADKRSDQIAQALDTNYMVAQHQSAAMDEATKLKDQVALAHTRVANGDIAAGQDIERLATKQQKLDTETDAAADIQLAALQSIDKIIEEKKSALSQLESDIEAISIGLKENFEATEQHINEQQQQRIQQLEQKVKDAEQAGSDPAISKEELLAAQAEVEQLHAAHRKEFDDQLAVLQTKREEKVKELESKYAKLLADKQTELDKEAARIQALHDSRVEKVDSDTVRQNAVVNLDGPNTIQDQLDARNQTLKDTSANMQNEQLLALHQRHETELEDLKRQLRDEKQTAEGQLQQEHETMDKKLAEAQAELENQKASFRDLGNRLDIDLTAKQKQVEDVNSVKEQLEKQLADQEARFAETYKQLEQAAIEAKKREEDAEKVAKISEVLQLEQQKVSDLRKVALELVDRVEDSETRQAIQQQTLERCRDTIDQLLKTHSELQKQYIALKWEYDTVATVNTAVEQMKEDYQRVKSELFNLQSTFRSIDRAIASLKGKRMFRSKGEKSISSTDTTQAIQDVLEDYSYFRSDYMQIINDLRKNVVGLVETINDKSPTLDIKGLEHRYNVLRMKDPNAAQSYLYEEVLKWYREAAETKQEVAVAFNNLYEGTKPEFDKAEDEIKMIPHLDGSLEFYKAVHEIWNKFVQTIQTTRDLKPLFKGLDLVSVFVGDGDAQADRLRGLLMVLVANENICQGAWNGLQRQLRTVLETGVNLPTMVTPNYQTLMGNSWNQLVNSINQYDQIISSLRRLSGGGQKGGSYETEKQQVIDLGRDIRAKVQSIVDQWVGQKTLRQNIPEHLKALGLGSGSTASAQAPIWNAPTALMAPTVIVPPPSPQIVANGPLSAAASDFQDKLLAEVKNIAAAVNKWGPTANLSSSAQPFGQPQQQNTRYSPLATNNSFTQTQAPLYGQQPYRSNAYNPPWSPTINVSPNMSNTQSMPSTQSYQGQVPPQQYLSQTWPNQQPNQWNLPPQQMNPTISVNVGNQQRTDEALAKLLTLVQTLVEKNAKGDAGIEQSDVDKATTIVKDALNVHTEISTQLPQSLQTTMELSAASKNLLLQVQEQLREAKAEKSEAPQSQQLVTQILVDLPQQLSDNASQQEALMNELRTLKAASEIQQKNSADIASELQKNIADLAKQVQYNSQKRDDTERQVAIALKEEALGMLKTAQSESIRLQALLDKSQETQAHDMMMNLQNLQQGNQQILQILQAFTRERSQILENTANSKVTDSHLRDDVMELRALLLQLESLRAEMLIDSAKAKDKVHLFEHAAEGVADAGARANISIQTGSSLHLIQQAQQEQADNARQEANHKEDRARHISSDPSVQMARSVIKVYGQLNSHNQIDSTSSFNVTVQQLGLDLNNLGGTVRDISQQLADLLRQNKPDAYQVEKLANVENLLQIISAKVDAQRGPKGDTGQQGFTGEQGLRGETGLQGEQGPIGNSGPQDLGDSMPQSPVADQQGLSYPGQQSPSNNGSSSNADCQGMMTAFHAFFREIADLYSLPWQSTINLPCTESNIVQLSDCLLHAIIQQRTYSRQAIHRSLEQVLAKTPQVSGDPSSFSETYESQEWLTQFKQLQGSPSPQSFAELQRRLVDCCRNAQRGGSKVLPAFDTIYQLAGSLQADRQSLTHALQHQENVLKSFAQAARRTRQKKTTQGGGPTFDARTLLDSYDISKINRVVIALNKLIQEKFDSFKKQKDGEIRDVELELDNQEFRKKIDELTQSIQQLSEVATQAANRALTLEDEVYRLQNVTRNMKLFLLGMRDNKDSTYIFYNDLNVLRALKRHNQASIFDWSQAVPVVDNKTTNVRQVLRWYNGANMDKRISSELVREVLDSLIVLHRDLDNSRIFEEEQERLRSLYQVQSQLREAVSKFNSAEYEQLRADLEDIRQVSNAIQQQATSNDDQLAETQAALNSMLFGNQDQVVHQELLNATFADLVQGLGEKVNRLETFADVQVWLAETPYKWRDMFSNAGPLAESGLGDNEEDRVLVVAFALATAPNNIIRQLLDTQNTLNNSDIVTDTKEIELAFFRLQTILAELQKMLVGDDITAGVLDSIPLKASSHYSKLANIYELAGAALSILKVGLPVNWNSSSSPEAQLESLTSTQLQKLREIRGNMKVYQKVRTALQDTATQVIDFLSNARGMTVEMKGGNADEGLPSNLRQDSSDAPGKADDIQVSLFDPLSSFFRAWSGLQQQYFSGGADDVDLDEFIDQMTPEKRDAWLSTAGAKESALKSQLQESQQDEPNETERLLKSKLDQLKLLRRYFEAQRSTEKQMTLVEEQKREAEKQAQQALSKLDDPTDDAQQANAFGFLEPIEQIQSTPTRYPMQNVQSPGLQTDYPANNDWGQTGVRYPVQDAQSPDLATGYPANNEWGQNVGNTGYPMQDAQSPGLATGYLANNDWSQNVGPKYNDASQAALPTLFATVIPEYTDLLNPNTLNNSIPNDANFQQESQPVQQLKDQAALTRTALNTAQSALTRALSGADESDVPFLQGLAQKVQEASFQFNTNLPRMLTSAQSGNALASETAYEELDSTRDVLSRVREVLAELALTEELRKKLTRIERMIPA